VTEATERAAQREIDLLERLLEEARGQARLAERGQREAEDRARYLDRVRVAATHDVTTRAALLREALSLVSSLCRALPASERWPRDDVSNWEQRVRAALGETP